MRILFEGEEYQVGTLKDKGNTIVNGKAIAWNGKLLEGVEDITQYKIVDGEKVEIEVEVDTSV